MDYESIRKKYRQFTYPMTTVTVAGKVFAENKADLVLSDMTVELSSSVEASVAFFSIYNVYDQDAKQYMFEKFRQYVQLGSSVTVSMGYADILEDIFVGFIAQTRFICEDGGMHHVEVTAMDAKGMMMANSFVRQMTASNYGDAVREIFRRPVYEKLLSEGIYRKLCVTDTPDSTQASEGQVSPYTVEMVSESDYEFIVKAARRFGYEFFVDAGIVFFRKEKQVQEDCLIELNLHKCIRDYDITYDMTGLVKQVEVRGMDTSKASMVSAVKSVSNKISTGNKAKALIAESSRVVVDAASLTKEQAQYRAESLMEEISYRFGTLECTCIGIPELRPGHFIRLSGFGGPCDNRFYVTQAKHVMTDEGGYTTRITALAASLPS